MQYKRYFLMVLGIVFCAINSISQAVLMPTIPQVGLVTKTQLWNVSVTYPLGETVYAKLTIHVRDRSNNTLLLSGESSRFQLNTGTILLSENTLGPINYVFEDVSLSSSSMLVAGLYQICYVLALEDKKSSEIKECVELDIEGMTPPQLIFPADTSILTSRTPLFSWVPPTPSIIFPNIQYDMVIVEVADGQNPTDAIQKNLPIYTAFNLSHPTTAYSSGATDLENGKVYAWQVLARNGFAYGGKSEVWTFKVKDSTEVAELKTVIKTYVKLNAKPYSAVYAASNPLLFMIPEAQGITKANAYLLEMNDNNETELDRIELTLNGSGEQFQIWRKPNLKSKAKNLLLKVVLSDGRVYGCVLIKSED